MTRLFASAFALIVLAAALPLPAQTPDPSPTPDKRAEGLLALMAQAYADMESYSDTSTAIYRNRDGSERLHVDFKIWFVRPNEFRIDASSKTATSKAPRREVMWTNGPAVRSWASDKAVTSSARVKLIGSGMFGTYAYHIPTLLEESYGGAQRLHNMTAPAFVAQEEVDGVHCYRIRGTWVGDEYEVWLGTVDNLVRKITAKYRDHQLEETHREISVNQPIDKEVFQFAPEEEKLPRPKSSPPPTATPVATKRKQR
jgi:outer membrane lipoprotein-sorting protein